MFMIPEIENKDIRNQQFFELYRCMEKRRTLIYFSFAWKEQTIYKTAKK